MKDYNKENIPLAKTLRKNMTPWERKLWYDFLRYYPVRFQRQKAIGNYIADFYCVKARLVIELDGGGHYTAELARVYLKTITANVKPHPRGSEHQLRADLGDLGAEDVAAAFGHDGALLPADAERRAGD